MALAKLTQSEITAFCKSAFFWCCQEFLLAFNIISTYIYI